MNDFTIAINLTPLNRWNIVVTDRNNESLTSGWIEDCRTFNEAIQRAHTEAIRLSALHPHLRSKIEAEGTQSGDH